MDSLIVLHMQAGSTPLQYDQNKVGFSENLGHPHGEIIRFRSDQNVGIRSCSPTVP